MADDASVDTSGPSTGPSMGAAESEFDDEGSTTNYGESRWAHSERGPNSLPNVQSQSFSNTGVPGSMYIQDRTPTSPGADAVDTLARGSAWSSWVNNYLQRNQAPSTLMPSSMTSGMNTPSRSMSQEEEDPQKKPEQKPTGGGGGGMPMSKPGYKPNTFVNEHAVQPNPFPFQPVIPQEGSGMKRSFFTTQASLLQAMMPYWKMAQGGR